MSQDIILDRDRVSCLVNEFASMLKHEAYFQFKIRFDDDKTEIVPHADPVERVIRKEG